jgi:NAD(P)-dependent dehydrogenase (short-subunit alcohol dehydrogenase family)
MDLRLNGRVAVVTGASKGIGLAVTRTLLEEGARVVAASRTSGPDLDALAGPGLVHVPADLTDPDAPGRVVERAVEEFGGLDILVNNAGIMDRMSATADVADAEWDRVILVNLTAPFRLTRSALPHMLAKGKGAIVNTASEASLRGSAAGTAYTVSKHGIAGLTRSTAVQYRNRGIRVNAVAPGGTNTNIAVDMDRHADGPTVIGSYRHNVGRIADPSEIAAAIVFLASDDASNINGVILAVDNGWSAV